MKKIIVLGSMNMDLVIHSPYMPAAGETIKGSGFMTNSGGKGANQAAACGKMGGKVLMSACVGDDVFGNSLRENLQSYGVDTTFIRTAENTPSGIAVIVVAEKDNRIILDSGANACLNAADADRVLSQAGKGDILITQLETPLETSLYALKKAKDKGMVTLFNPAPADKNCLSLLPFVDVLVPNESELEILSGCSDLESGAEKLMELGVKKLIVTLGSKGSLLIDGEKRVKVPAFKVEAVDTTAAGDTFLGTLAVGLAEGEEIETAMIRASAASALAVTKAGAQVSIPYRNEVEDFLKANR